jgi:ubiquinone/menaquinone biosynthesis C-methylase UbiE
MGRQDAGDARAGAFPILPSAEGRRDGSVPRDGDAFTLPLCGGERGRDGTDQTPLGQPRALFDGQADTYDQRVGLPEQDCQAIVRAVLALAHTQPHDLLLEIGAGTGMIGAWFARLPLRYVGLDLSGGMLAAFRQRLSRHSGTPLLLHADGNAPWPLADGTMRVLFSARTLHLLDLAHVVSESVRVARPDGAVVLIGRVQRQDDSVAAMMQRELQRLLRHHGFQGRAGGQHQRQLLASYRQRGATVLAPVVVARWAVPWTPWQSIEAWRMKPGLGGLALPASEKDTILQALCRWATKTFGDLQCEAISKEAYVLQGIRLRPRGRG